MHKHLIEKNEKQRKKTKIKNKETGKTESFTKSFTTKSSKKKQPFQLETQLSNNTSNYGTIIDRFLPVLGKSPESKLFNHNQHLKSEVLYQAGSNINDHAISRSISNATPTNPNSNINVSINNTSTVNNSNNPVVFTNSRMEMNTRFSDFLSSDDELLLADNIVSSFLEQTETNSNNAYLQVPQVYTNTKSEKNHSNNVATALGFKTSRILTFTPLKSPKKYKSLQIGQSEEIVPNKSNNIDLTKNDSTNKENEYQTPEIPFKVLDAPGLRNDFYSNLVCWANQSDTIAAGLGSLVYCWSEKTGTVPLQAFGTEIISALSYSSDDFLAVATKDAKLFIYKNKSIQVIATYTMKHRSSICSLKWIPNSRYFFVGNEVGEVTLLELIQKEEVKKIPQKGKSKKDSKATREDPKVIFITYIIKRKVSFKCDQQQICGMDINTTGNQIAIGANNNSSSIWDISDLTKPKKLFHLKHEAAVKAVAFCPWVPNLLATGGGSRDKNIRFWHSTSGTLISQHKTNGQITAVVWSRSKREILVTFGFGENTEKNCILAVYTYPSMKLKVKVTAPSDMRILTADISNDFSSVCTSISDQSVRIYNVWNSKFDLTSGIYDDGMFGSEIIDTEEGIDKAIDIIR